MRMLLIANPASGSGYDADDLRERLRAHGADPVLVPIDEVDALGDADTRVRGVGRVAVAGGDGSIGPAARLATQLGVPLAVIPTGTANDLARALQLPLDDLDAAARLAATGTITRRLDVACAGDIPFLNAASSGLSVHATKRAEPLKGLLGPLAYAVGALAAGARARPLRVRVTVDGELLFSGGAWQVIVAGTGAFGGGSQLDDAEPGALDVAVVCGGPRIHLVRRAWGMRHGDLTGQDGVVSASGKTVTVEGPPAFNVDGDVRAVPHGRFTLGPRVSIVVDG